MARRSPRKRGVEADAVGAADVAAAATPASVSASSAPPASVAACNPLALPLVPRAVFFTKGCGVHAQRLQSFELALRRAGIAPLNLVRVSSILPPGAVILSHRKGLRELRAGQITFVVMSQTDTDEPNRLISASIGLATPADPTAYGYLSEHHAYGQTAKRSGDYAEDLAATMLASTLGIEFDPTKDYDERREIYRMSGRIVRTRSITQSAEGDKNGLWTTVLAAAVLLF